jgi:hypothetical protein
MVKILNEYATVYVRRDLVINYEDGSELTGDVPRFYNFLVNKGLAQWT